MNWIGYVIAGLIVFAVLGLFLAGLNDQGKSLESERLSATTRVYDDQRIFSLLPPDDNWKRLPPGTLEFGAALEFYGPTRDTWAIVYMQPDGDWNMDQIVEARRDEISQKTRTFIVSESRTLLTEPQIPISYAKYKSRRYGAHPLRTTWITTVETGSLDIEVIAATSDANEVQAIERFARSLKLSENSDAR